MQVCKLVPHLCHSTCWVDDSLIADITFHVSILSIWVVVVVVKVVAIIIRKRNISVFAEIVKHGAHIDQLAGFCWVKPNLTMQYMEAPFHLAYPSFHYGSCGFVGSESVFYNG